MNSCPCFEARNLISGICAGGCFGYSTWLIVFLDRWNCPGINTGVGPRALHNRQSAPLLSGPCFNSFSSCYTDALRGLNFSLCGIGLFSGGSSSFLQPRSHFRIGKNCFNLEVFLCRCILPHFEGCALACLNRYALGYVLHSLNACALAFVAVLGRTLLHLEFSFGLSRFALGRLQFIRPFT